MAKLTTNTGIFGARGVSDVEVFKPSVGVSRKIDLSLTPLTADKGATENYEFIALPKAFVMTGLYVEEVEPCSAAQITVKSLSDGATIGSAVTLGGDTPVTSVQNITAKTFAEGDILCLCVEGGSDAALAVNRGVLKVNAIGYLPDGDSLANMKVNVPYRTSGQIAGENASKGDLRIR